MGWGCGAGWLFLLFGLIDSCEEEKTNRWELQHLHCQALSERQGKLEWNLAQANHLGACRLNDQLHELKKNGRFTMGVGRRFTEFFLLPRFPLAVQFDILQNFLVVVKKISGLADDTMTSFSIADAQPRAAVSSLQDGGSSKAWKIAKRHQHAAESWHGERLHHLRRKLIVLSVRCFSRAPSFPHWDPLAACEREKSSSEEKQSVEGYNLRTNPLVPAREQQWLEWVRSNENNSFKV